MSDELVINYSDDIEVKVRHNKDVYVELSRQGPQGPEGQRGTVTPEMIALRDETLELKDEAVQAALEAETQAGDSAAAHYASVSARNTSQTAAANSEASRVAAVQALADASAVRDTVQIVGTEVITARDEARARAAAALVSEQNATHKAADAHDSAVIADSARSAAKISETNAEAHQSAAATSAALALTRKDEAASAALAARGAADDAEASALEIDGIEASVEANRIEVAANAADALQSKNSAATSASNAATHAANIAAAEARVDALEDAAAASAGQASTMRDSAASILAQLQGSYLGMHAVDPVVDLNGDPLDGGEVYVNQISHQLRVYTGVAWSDIGLDSTEVERKIQQAIDDLINGAGSTLDTLQEIADALGNDPNFAATITTALSERLVAAANLSDIVDTAAARQNIGAHDATNLTTGTLAAGRFSDASHGQRAGGDLHAVATQAQAGFMSAADKSKLDTLQLGDQTGTEIANAPIKEELVDGDSLAVVDSAESNGLKRTTWAQVKSGLKSYFDSLYATVSHVHAAATTSVAGFMSPVDKLKLDGVAAQATKNASDEDLRARETHTGTQPLASIDGLAGALDGKASLDGTSVAIPSGTTVERPVAPDGPRLRFNTTLNRFEGWNGEKWDAIGGLSQAEIVATGYIADGETKVFALPRQAGTAENITVHIDGGWQRPNIAYTVDGLDLEFTEMPAEGQIIDLLVMATVAELAVPSSNSVTADSITSDEEEQRAIRDKLKVNDGLPVGATIFSSTGYIFPGCFEMDGSTFDGEVYKDLFDYLGANVLPDTRNRVLRHVGVNTGPVGSTQEDAFQAHSHEVLNVVNYSGSDPYLGPNVNQWNVLGIDSLGPTKAPTDSTGGTETCGKGFIGKWLIKAASVPINPGTVDIAALVTDVSQKLDKTDIVGAIEPGNGRVIESGSNANGNYTKFADGTMICTGSVAPRTVGITSNHGSLFHGPWMVVSFPAAFAQPPVFNVSLDTNYSGLAFVNTSLSPTPLTTARYIHQHATSVTNSFGESWTAVGRWF